MFCVRFNTTALDYSGTHRFMRPLRHSSYDILLGIWQVGGYIFAHLVTTRLYTASAIVSIRGFIKPMPVLIRTDSFDEFLAESKGNNTHLFVHSKQILFVYDFSFVLCSNSYKCPVSPYWPHSLLKISKVRINFVRTAVMLSKWQIWFLILILNG